MNDLEKAEENLKNYVRKFKTCDLLEFFSKKSIISYQTDRKAYTFEELPRYSRKTGVKLGSTYFSYGQWELVQVCYYAIKYSNDFRGKTVEISDFYNLINENKIYDEIMEGAADLKDDLKLFEHLQCMSNVQFDFQTLNISSRFNRLYEIMININKNSDYCQTKEVCYIDFEKVFRDITGIEILKFINIYFFLILLSSTRKNTNIYDIIKDIKFDVERIGFSIRDILDVISFQSRDYEFYKKGDNWNLLKFYPIVKTKVGENNYIISNIYSLLYSFPDAIYWIIRNYYKKIDSSDFTIYFGYCFECYLYQLYERYNINYEKLEEINTTGIKTPDWKIETNNYIFIVEQKSSLFPINTRTTTKQERFYALESYINNNIIKAFRQLNAYSVNNSKKSVIRICLTFEKIYVEENMKSIIERKMKFNSDIDLNWILNIDEFEILMQILGEDEERFNKIIQEKINLEKNKDKNGRSFERLLKGCEYGYVNELNHFNRLGDELKDKLKNNCR